MMQAWQSWKSAKAVAFLVVVAFTVGIGSSTAIYTVVQSLLLKPIPYHQSERWASVTGATPGDPEHMSGLNLDDVTEYQQRLRSFDVFGWVEFTNYNLTAPGQPQFLNGVEVTPSVTDNIGVRLESGQWFHDAREPLAVISYALWQRLGADPGFAARP